MLLHTNLPASVDNSIMFFVLEISTFVFNISSPFTIICSFCFNTPLLSFKLQDDIFFACVSSVKTFLLLASPKAIIKS